MKMIRVVCGIADSGLGKGLRARRIAPRFIAAIALAVGVLLSPSNARGDYFSYAGPTLYGDDLNSAAVNPLGAEAVTGPTNLINTGLNAFLAANPANGSGPSGQAWTFTWAPLAVETQVEKQIYVRDYYPFVVTEPDVRAENGVNYPGEAVGELGGAVFNLEYAPPAGTTPIPNLHWIQALTGIRRGVPVPMILDTGPAYTSQSTVTPFYDTSAAAGTLPSGGAWFLDTPYIREFEYESNPVASIQFQVVLASDTRTLVDRVFQNAVTIYGGESWGFVYSAVDTPEPASLTLLGIGAVGLFGYDWRRRKRTAA